MTEPLTEQRLAEIEALLPDDDFGIHSGTCAISVEPGDPNCDCGLTEGFTVLLAEVRRLSGENRELQDRIEAAMKVTESGVLDVRVWGERGTPYSNGAERAFRTVRRVLSSGGEG